MNNPADGRVAEWLIRAMLPLAALIHLLPAAGWFRPELLSELYGLSPGANPDLTLLMRHRGAMFGLLATALMAAIWQRQWRGLCIAWTVLSDFAFVLLVVAAWPPSPSLLRVFWADVVSLAALLVAILAMRSARGVRV